MVPPQAPPAHTTHANQAAFDRLQRMEAIQTWLAEQQEVLPEAPLSRAERDTFLATFDAFWEAGVAAESGQPAIPRRQALARHLARAMRDDASLRRDDGTLLDADAALVTGVALHTVGPLSSHSRAWELLFGTTPYAGALVVQDARDGGRVLLFTVEAGWQAFDSLGILYRDVELELRAQLAQRDELPGIGLNDSEAVLGTHFLATRAIDTGSVAEVLTLRLVARLRERIADAFDLAATDSELHDRLHDARNLHALLDTHAIVRQRDLALTAQLETERLNAMPAPVREDWKRSADDYRNTWRLEADTVSATMPSMAAFAEQKLGEALRKQGIDAAPRNLYLRLTRMVAHQPIATLISGFPTEDLSLLELAYRNVSNLSTERLQVIHADGSARDDIPAETLRTIVRELDLPAAYTRHLEDTFRDSPEGHRQRATAGRLLRARMRFEAANARLYYYDPREPASFVRGDPLYRGFHWVQAVLDHPAPAHRARVEGHAIAAYQFTYKGTPLAGVFLFAPRQKSSGDSVVLYTPDAPDGRTFRQMSRRDLKRDIFLKKSFKTYLLDRLPAAFAEVDAYGRRRFKIPRVNGDRSVGWVFNFSGSDCRDCNELDEDFEEREVTGSFLDAAYDTVVDLAKRNAEEWARSTTAADWNGGTDAVFGWNIAFNVVKEFIVGAVRGTFNTAQASWRFYDHVKAGENTAAFLTFVEGYTSGITSVLPIYSQVPRVVGASVRAAAGSRALASRQRALPAPETLFEKQYLAHDMTLAGREPASGVHAVAGQHYIQQGGKTYHVKWDAAFDTWRLAREHATVASNTGPAIERLADGQWVRSRVGLRGGMQSDDFAEAFLLANALLDQTRMSPELQALTQFQRSVVAAHVRNRLPFEEALHVIRHKGGVIASTLTTRQRLVWENALIVGRQAVPPAPPASLRALAGAGQPAATSQGASPARPQPPRTPPVIDLTTTPPQTPAHQTPPIVDLTASPPRTPPASAETSGAMARPAPMPGPSGSRGRFSKTIRAEHYAFAPPRDLMPLLPRSEWPESAYVYLHPGRIQQMTSGTTITLEQRVIDAVSVGVPMTTLPPTTLMADVPPALLPLLPRATSAARTLGEMSGGWIRIDLRNLPTNTNIPQYGPHKYYFSRHEIQASLVETGYYLRPVKTLYRDSKGVFSESPVVLPSSAYTIGMPP